MPNTFEFDTDEKGKVVQMGYSFEEELKYLEWCRTALYFLEKDFSKCNSEGPENLTQNIANIKESVNYIDWKIRQTKRMMRSYDN